MTFTVTAAHIATYPPGLMHSPIDAAIADGLGIAVSRVMVNGERREIYIARPGRMQCDTYAAPISASQAEQQWLAGKQVEPFEFEVEALERAEGVVR